MSFGLDLVVIVAYFAVILGIGLSQRSKSGSVEGFALGDRQTPWWAVLASIIAAEISAATFLGAPGEGFEKRNWTYVQLAIGTIMARIFVSTVFIPVYYKHGVISIYEFLQTRFGPLTRKAASITFMVTRVLAMGTRLYVSAIIVVLAFAMFKGHAVTPTEKFWLFTVALVLVSLLTAVYTTMGGIRAVIWTDFIQVGVLITAVGFAIAFLIGKLSGGWPAIGGHIQPPVFFDWGTNGGNWPDFTYILTNEYTIWAAFIASTFVTMATHGIDQDTVQRMLTAKNMRQSAFATILSGLADVPITSAFVFIGLLLSLYYQQHPDTGMPVDDTREVFPYFILHVMPAGLRGLVTAGILATAMGSLSTALNALSTSFARDFVFPRRGEISEKQRVRILRQSTLLFAVAIISVGVATAWYVTWHPETRIIPLVLGILGYTFGSVLGVFLVALFTKTRGNDFGNLLGMSCGFAAVLFLSNVLGVQEAVGIQKPFVLAFPWRITLGTLVTVAVALCFKTEEKPRMDTKAHE
jgi:solute:Na+ symporter, SSS family